MRTVSVFAAGERYVLEDTAGLLTRAHQALATLERYKHRLDDAAAALTALEIEDRAAIADIARLAQRLEMASRVTEEIAGYLVELGTDAGLLGLQLDELTAGTRRERELLLRDYVPAATAPGGAASGERAHAADRALSGLSADELADLPSVAAAIGLGPAAGLDEHVSPLGYRLLGQVPRLPRAAADGLVAEFGSLQKLLSASAQDLHQVPGIDAGLAGRVREGLSRIAESALLERYS